MHSIIKETQADLVFWQAIRSHQPRHVYLQAMVARWVIVLSAGVAIGVVAFFFNWVRLKPVRPLPCIAATGSQHHPLSVRGRSVADPFCDRRPGCFPQAIRGLWLAMYRTTEHVIYNHEGEAHALPDSCWWLLALSENSRCVLKFAGAVGGNNACLTDVNAGFGPAYGTYMAFTLVYAALSTFPVTMIASGGLADGGGISELKVRRLFNLAHQHSSATFEEESLRSADNLNVGGLFVVKL